MGYPEVMIRVICGDDEFAVSNALDARLDAITTPDLRDANVTTFDSPNTSLSEVMDTSRAVPFMSDRRAVVVKGMLGPLEDRKGRVRADWSELGKVIARDGFSIVNELIFVDYVPLRLSNPNLKPLAAVAEVERYSPPKRGELEKWVRERTLHHDLQFTAKGLATFMLLAGDATRRIDSELNKLALYADGRRLNERDVALMVSDAHDDGIFRVVDAVIDRNSRSAIGGLHRIVQNGETVDGVIHLLSRQIRTLILAKEMMARGVPRQEMGTRLEIRFNWLLEKTTRQASRSGMERLVAMHRQILEVDHGTKTGRLNRDLSMEILIAKLASL